VTVTVAVVGARLVVRLVVRLVARLAVRVVGTVVAAPLVVVDHRLPGEALATTHRAKTSAGTVTVTTTATAVGIVIALAAPIYGRLWRLFTRQ